MAKYEERKRLGGEAEESRVNGLYDLAKLRYEWDTTHAKTKTSVGIVVAQSEDFE